MFREFWRETDQAGEPFPLRPEKLSEFAIYLATVRHVGAESVKQHISAVKHFDTLHNGDVQRRLQLVIKAIANDQVNVKGPKPPQPAWSPEAVIKATNMLAKVVRGQASMEIMDAQALIVSIIGFLYAQRATSIADMKLSDLKLDPKSLTFVQQRTKSKQAYKLSEFKIPIANCKPARVVREFLLKLQKSPEKLHPDSELLSHWPKTEPSQRVGAALARARSILNLPEAQGLQSHALRRGAAIAMLAVGVPEIRILSWGGWKETNCLQPYTLGREWTETSGASEECFGWMRTSMRTDSP